MSVGDRKRMRRGIMSALRPLTGDVATGTVRASTVAGAGDITIPRNCHLLPIVGSATGRGELAHDMPLRVSAETEVSEAGTDVPVASVLGGSAYNLPLGTVMRWDPPLVGVSPTATVVNADMSGGANAVAGPGVVREIRAFETLESLQAALDLFQAEAGNVPALVIGYSGMQLVEVAGEASVLDQHRWLIYAITSWGGSSIDVGNEALDLLDVVGDKLRRRSSSLGLVFSAPAADITAVRRVRVTPTSFVWAVEYATFMGARREDHRPYEGVTYADWLTTRLTLTTQTVAQPAPLPVVDQIVEEH